jgi:hypothetical protein
VPIDPFVRTCLDSIVDKELGVVVESLLLSAEWDNDLEDDKGPASESRVHVIVKAAEITGLH